MSQNPFDTIAPNEKRLLSIRQPLFFGALLLIMLGACAPINQQPIVVEPANTPEPRASLRYSAEPIIPAKAVDVRFAQQALNKLGYKIGAVDGLWGPRSAAAIRAFESKSTLTTANGHLSELNLHQLEVESGLSRTNYGALQTNSPTGISAKLSRVTPLTKAPQLIIVDREYRVLSKPNPYSSELLTLAPGTGIYVIAEQDGYFEIESINRKRGFIKVD